MKNKQTREKRVKRRVFAVYDPISGQLHYDFNEKGDSVLAFYPTKGEAEDWAEELGARVVRTTIEFTLPNSK